MAEETLDVKTGLLTIRGVGKAHVSPDTAEIGVTIVSRGSTPDEAADKASANLEEVKKAIKKAPAPIKALRTLSFEVKPFLKKTTLPNGNVEETQDGFVAKQVAAMKMPIRNGNHMRAISAIARNCPDARTSLAFTVKNTKTLERELLRTAAKTALSEAKVLAKTIGAKILGVSNIEKNDTFVPVPGPRKVVDFSAVAVSNSIALIPTDIDVSLSVTVSFYIAPDIA